ncbi:MAG: protein phosphatase CheZ [Betaproteobacteria bacterium]|nr:protein phosphatase CheZ [Betaproteobacteria bacterium]
MVAKRKIDETGDSDELQSLFDNIAAGGGSEEVATAETAPAPSLAPAPRAASGKSDEDDNEELQALFDTESNRYAAPTANGVASAEETDDRDTVMFNRIGKMTRKLHDMLVELGLDSKLQAVADSVPDARQRLTYVVQMTEQAASRVLNAADIARPLVEKIQEESGALHTRWGSLFDNRLSVEEFKALATETRTFLGLAVEGCRTVDTQLFEIIMAQDFQDLTGQVIKKVLEMAQGIESQLLSILIEAAPEDAFPEKAGSLLNGPVINGEGRDDVVTDQGQVDDLLASLGF